MNLNRKIIFIAFFCLISTVLGYYLFLNHSIADHSEQLLPQNSDSQQLLEDLKREDEQLWQELAQYGIDKKECDQFKKQYAKEYKNIRKEFEDNALETPLSAETLAMIHRIFDEFKINKKTVTIIPFKAPNSPAAATDHQLLIDEKQLLQFPQEAQEYTIAHEVQHIIHQDDSTSFFLESILELTDDDFNNPDHIINKRARFEEKRADVLASLKKPVYAQGNILFMKKLLEQRKKESAGITHPKEKTRIALAETILTQCHSKPKLA